MAAFVEFNNDQRRETVNTRQRYQAWRAAAERELGFRGSMTWSETDGEQYLLRSYYDERGRRRQKSLGRHSAETQALKARFEAERSDAVAARKSLDAVMDRQAAVNWALGLGRVPQLSARILRILDARGLLGHELRVVGTNALYAYELACGVFINAGLTATEDIDPLFDARTRLYLIGDAELPPADLLQLLRRADRSFRPTRQRFRVQNDEGFLVDLIKPMTNPPWRQLRNRIGDAGDIEAAEINGLQWLENAPAFEQTAIDERGQPLRIVAPDPRAFAVHKQWLSTRADRNPIKKSRDAEQAAVVAALTRQFLPNLSFAPDELRFMPREIVDAAVAAFGAA